MALTAPQVREVWRKLASRTERDAPVALTKADLQAAVEGVDAYLDANAAAMNQAIPQPARGSLTAQQKAALFAAVALTRYGEG